METHSKDGTKGNDGATGLAPLIERELLELASSRTVVNAELNLAKFGAFLFAPSHTQEEARARAKSWVATNPATGEKVLARVIVHTVDRQTLTTFDHRACLALQKLWWERPRHEPTGTTPLVLRDIARTMRIGWGRKTYLLLKASLRKLRQVPISWRYAFVDRTTGHVIGDEDILTILGELRFLDRYLVSRGRGAIGPEHLTDEQADPNRGASAFRFHPRIERNLLRRFTKPVFFDVAMGIRGEIGLALYSLLDIVMADKLTWERRVTELLRDDLNVRGTYRWPADRRRLVARAIRELQGKAISTGTLKLSVVRTKNDDDDKLVVQKTPLRLPRRLAGSASNGSYLTDQLVALTGDERSRPYYAKLVRELPESTVWALMSETRQAEIEGRIRTTKARYLTDLAERELGHKPRGGESGSADLAAAPGQIGSGRSQGPEEAPKE